MCKKTKQILSIIMSLVMIVTMFTGLDILSWAVDQIVVEDKPHASGNTSSVDASQLVVEPLKIDQYTNGYWNAYIDEETGENVYYYNYNLRFNNFTVKFSDGTEMSSTDGSISYKDFSASIKTYYYQQSNPLHEGINEIDVWLKDCPATATVEIVPADKTLEVEDITIVECTKGNWSQKYDSNTGEMAPSYWYTCRFDDYTVTLEDGTALKSDDTGRLTYEDSVYGIASHENQFLYPFKLGVNKIPVSILGAVTMASVEVVECPVASITTSTITLQENTDGRWEQKYEYSDDGEDGGKYVDYFEYKIPVTNFTVVLKDGTELVSQNKHVVYNDVQYWAEEVYEQKDRPLSVGMNEVEISILGFRTTVKVEVVAAAVKPEESTSSNPPAEEETTTEAPSAAPEVPATKPSIEVIPGEEKTTEESSGKPQSKPSEPASKPSEEVTVKDKIDVGAGISVDEKSNTLSFTANNSTADIAKLVKNEKFAIVDKNGKALKKDALVGTGSRIQIMDSSNKVVSEYTVVVPTDVDGNGKTSAADARLALRASAKLETGVVGAYAMAADMSADGKVSAADARRILRISAGLDKI